MSIETEDRTQKAVSEAVRVPEDSPTGSPPSTPNQQPSIPAGAPLPPAPRPSSRNWLDWRILSVLVLALVSVSIWRATSHANVQRPAATSAPPIVAVARVDREDLFNEVAIVAEFRPYAEVDLHAKVSGYVQEINVDIGDRVKAGQLLAKLEVPELQDELHQALAAQKRAEADYRAAHLAYTRLLAVDKQNPNLVVQQDLDAAEAKDLTTEAAIAAAKAGVEKYQTLLAYTRIAAPFDGVITHRYADPGSLIQSGTASDTQSLPLVRLSDNYRLRLDFPVSVVYVKDVELGDPVEVRVESLGSKTFTGTISRFTHKVNDDTRTMITEIEVANPNLELIPGMYAKALLRVQKHPHALTIPTEAVSSDKNATVYVINRQGEIEERAVTLGLETSTRFEVKDGLQEGDLIMIGARSEVKPGEKVEPRLIGSLVSQ
jgi:RND family efflux transporter MFP subunit